MQTYRKTAQDALALAKEAGEAVRERLEGKATAATL